MAYLLPGLAGLGFLLAVSVTYKLIDFVHLYTRSSGLDKYLSSSSGKPAWALVTGATAGLGKAIAHELAAFGFNVVLHGRNVSKLESVKSELQSAYPARDFRLLVVNATTCYMESEVWAEEVLELVQDLELKVLVNNAGGSNEPIYGTLDEYNAKRILDTVYLNAVFPTLMMSTLIPVLLKNGPGLIINVGSLSDNGLPLVSFYAASKAYGGALSLSVAREMQLEKRDVEVITHRVGLVAGSGYNLDLKPHFFAPSATVMARAILARTGCGRKSVVPYWTHAMRQSLLMLVPGWVGDLLIISVMTNLRDEERAKKTK